MIFLRDLSQIICQELYIKKQEFSFLLCYKFHVQNRDE